VIDDVIVTFFQEPASYTGEDTIEIAGHGGILVTRRLLERLLMAGARPAEPGEFTQRAFLNGKMELTQAEAVMDVIRAQSDLALRAAREQLSGRLGERFNVLRAGLMELMAHVEAWIDFPDEEIDPDTGDSLIRRAEGLHSTAHGLLATAESGRILREGVRVAILGPPNAGKSTLLNALLGRNRAIVSPQPGTTRDTLEEMIQLGGIPFQIIDTAGIHESADPVECEGMERSWAAASDADFILELADATAPPSARLSPFPERTIWILNKFDLPVDSAWNEREGWLRISSLTEEGLVAVRNALTRSVSERHGRPERWEVAVNSRHQDCLRRFVEGMERAITGLRTGTPMEFVAEELRTALRAVGDISGRVESDDILGVIFGSFCIGK
jgi:tRNA modification GTPase